MIYLARALGGARCLVTIWYEPVVGRFRLRSFTSSDFQVNLIGALLIGVLFVGADRSTLSEPARLGMSVGFLGAFTTFSAFLLQVLTDIQEGHVLRVVFYASATVFLSLLSCLAGMELARSVFD